ncbi:CGNR zinc finger domain-containing protein [soil metagenome]
MNDHAAVPSGSAFDAGRLCLRFLAVGRDADQAVGVPAVAAWAAEVLDVTDLAGPTAEEQRDAVTLSDAISRLCAALAAGQQPAVGDLARLNRIAAQPDLAPQLGSGGERSWAWPVTVGQVLSTIARDAVALLTGPGRHRVRRCAGDGCGRLFLDLSRPGSRRWCAMTRCGNRAKVRAFRARS